jgi:eukaryotic-like serine/threonine-protein kinase
MAFRERSLPAEIGRYKIVRLLGQGAMGRVLLGHDPVLDRDVAVKLLRDDLAVPEDQVQALLDRMRQEARAAARVSHPNIVALHDMGEDATFGLYLAFEYLDGSTLKDRLERGALGPIAAARLSTELGSALATAHEAGVLHRDIKPENIILTKTGSKIADFGIARLPDSTLTLGGGLLGTPAYSAPEAVSGSKFSPKTDQFSMAATLYEAISGQRAFPGDDAVAVASKIATEQPPGIAEAAGVDPRVDEVISRAMAKDPRDRFDSCDEFGTALGEALRLPSRSTMETLPDKVHGGGPPQETAGVHVARAATGGIAVGAMLTIVGFQLTAHLRHEDDQGHPPAEAPVAAVRETEAEPVAWLAERPKPAKGARAKGGDHARTVRGRDTTRDGGAPARRRVDAGGDGGRNR